MSKYSHMMQTITAYKYSFRKLRDNTPIISGDGTLGTVNVKELLLGFSEYAKKPKRSGYLNKILSLEVDTDEENDIYNSRIHFKARSGRYGQSTIAVDINNSDNITTLDINKAICHYYNVFFYINFNVCENICIFHCYGRGGCKTIFLELFSKYLREKDLILDMSALVSQEQEDLLYSGLKTKLLLVKNSIKEKRSSDIFDNIDTNKKRVSNNTEMELTINLKNKNICENIKGNIDDIINKTKTVSEVFTIPENFEYNQTKFEMNINNRTKTIDIDDLGGFLTEKEITTKLEFDKDNEPTFKTLSRESDAYYISQKERL